MQNRKIEETMHWKNKLEELDNLPGETWDKDVAWEKLHQRVEGKPRNKKIIYRYALIAACLVFLLSLYWIVGNKSEKKALPAKLETITKLNPASDAVKNKENSISVSTPKKRTANKIDNIKNKLIYKDKIVLLDTMINEKSNPDSIHLTEENQFISSADTTAVLIVKNPVKLKVVHINELGKPVAEKIKLAHTPKSFQSRYEERVSNFYSNNTDDNIFRIKLSPHN